MSYSKHLLCLFLPDLYLFFSEEVNTVTSEEGFSINLLNLLIQEEGWKFHLPAG